MEEEADCDKFTDFERQIPLEGAERTRAPARNEPIITLGKLCGASVVLTGAERTRARAPSEPEPRRETNP
jgi:hypothetical protein